MKRTLLSIVFVISFVANTFSQEYYPMLNRSTWIVNDMVSCCRQPIVKYIQEGTDEVIGNYTYKRFEDPFPQYDSHLNAIPIVYIREDVAARKVYKIVEGVDTLLYDFTMHTGDVISQYGNTFTATVDTIVLLDGSTRKRITLISSEQYCGDSLTQVWIEGVGSDKHPFYPENNMYNVCSASGGLTIFTKCSFQNGVHIYGNSDCPNLMQSMLNVAQPENPESAISFSPNPFHSELTIRSSFHFTEATISVYNTIGQLMFERRAQSGNEFVINRQQ